MLVSVLLPVQKIRKNRSTHVSFLQIQNPIKTLL